MDTNDYKNGESGYGQPYTYQYGADQQQPGGYYYNPYNNPYGAPNNKPPERKGLRRALIAIFMVFCLILGSAIGVYLISPGLGERDESNVAMTAPTSTRQSDVEDQEYETEQSGALTTESPQIGGEKPDINDSESPIVQIVDAVSPSVVIVRIDDPSVPDDYDAQGTGFIISSDGYIVTNNHVVEERGSFDVVVQTSDGEVYKAGVVGGDEATDLAVLKIDATGLNAAATGNSDDLQIGEEVVAIGNALGLGSGTVTSGIISGLNQQITNEDGYTQEYIQTDAAINPGNSGGPLIDMDGQVIGINTLKDTVAGYDANGQMITAEGIGYAIPIDTAIPVIQQLMTEGSVERPGIGVSCLVDEYNEYNPAGSPEGVTVVSVTEGGPANLAGIQANDIITKADGQAVTTVEDLTAAIRNHAVGEEMNLTVWRGGVEYPVSVTVGDLNQMG